MSEQDDQELAATRPQQHGGDAQPPPHAYRAGEMLNERYRLVEPLGTGSTGAVFTANDLAFDRVVAVKVMSHGSGDGTALFLREARITAQLDHPNIVPIHDLVWLSGGGVAFAMKHIDGSSLREALRQAVDGRPPRCLATVNDIINVFLKVCDGIALAHARGVIHRDIKPDNIVIGQFGEVIILDWGEASSGERQGGPSSAVGTPMYMSPEQARGEPATPASDVYCIAASMFHCLLHRPPLDASRLEPEQFWERKRRGAIDAPTPADAARCDRRLLAVLRKALAAEPAGRYATVRALADDLAAFQAGQAVSAYRESWLERSLRWHHRHARTVWLSTLLAGTALALAAVLWGSHLQQFASWGSPVFSDSFGDGWEEHWRVGGTDQFDIAAGRAVSRRDTQEGTLVLRREWPPSCAIEFTGEVLPGAEGGDISVFWLEGSAAVDGHWRQCRSGWLFQFGAWDNTSSVLKTIDRGVIACSRTVQVPGRKHRIRAEVDGDRRRLSIDGSVVFDHQDSFNAGAGRWQIYTWGAGKAISDVAVHLRGSAEVVPALGIPDALRRNGLGREAVAEYLRIAASQPGALADQARLKAGITLGELGDWSEASTAWNRIVDPVLHEEASLLALRRLIQSDPRQLCNEIEARWAGASPSGRRALIQMWMAMGSVFDDASHCLDGDLAERFLDLRRRLFPAAIETDWTTWWCGTQTGRLRLAASLVLNPCLRGQLLEQLGEWQRLRDEGTGGKRARAERLLFQPPGPLVAYEPASEPVPDWLARALAGEAAAVRPALVAAGDRPAVIRLDRMFGDPLATLSEPPADPSRVVSLWLSAIAAGDPSAAARWERACLRCDADRTGAGDWGPLLLEPIGILAGLGRLAEARGMAAQLRAVPRLHWSGAATAWGEALAGETVPVLPGIVHPDRLLAALRADLAGDAAAAADCYKDWFAQALPSYAKTSPSLLRLARWRAGLR